MLCQVRMNAVGKEVFPDEGLADDIRRRSNIMMGRMSQGVVNLIIRRPLNESVERLRGGRIDGCTADCWKSKESVSDERICERSRGP